MLPEDPRLAKVQGAAMMGAGSTFALGILPKTSARILALTLIPTTFIGHPFWKSAKPEDRRPQLVHFLKNARTLRRPPLRERGQAHAAGTRGLIQPVPTTSRLAR